MFKLKYRYCKARMTAYLNGELSPGARRRMARYIAECPDCYAEYLRQLDLTRELESRVGGFGTPGVGQLDRIWANIEAEITTPAPAPPVRRRRARYGLVLLMLLLATLLPWTLGNRNVAFDVPSQPAPELNTGGGTPARVQDRQTGTETVMLVLTGPVDRTPKIDLRNTPAPPIP